MLTSHSHGGEPGAAATGGGLPPAARAPGSPLSSCLSSLRSLPSRAGEGRDSERSARRAFRLVALAIAGQVLVVLLDHAGELRRRVAAEGLADHLTLPGRQTEEAALALDVVQTR